MTYSQSPQPAREPVAWMLRDKSDPNYVPWPTRAGSEAHTCAAKRPDFECRPLVYGDIPAPEGAQLPPLPQPLLIAGGGQSWFNAEQMHAYARAALAAQPVVVNGLTEAETSETASVKGLIARPSPAEGDRVRAALEMLANYCEKRGFATETVSAAYLAEARDALAANVQPKGTANYIVSIVMTKPIPSGANTQNKLYGVEAVSPEEAHGKAIALAQSDFPEHQFHTACHWLLQAPAPAPLPNGWRLQTVSDGDIRMYSPTGSTWLLRANTNEDFYDFIHGFLSDLMAANRSPAVGAGHIAVMRQALEALESAPRPVEHVLPFSNVCDCSQCASARATKSALSILRSAVSQPPVQGSQS